LLLPIVLLLASAGPTQQAINVAPSTRQFSLTEENPTRQFSLTNRHPLTNPRTYRIVSPGPQGFVIRKWRNGTSPDSRMIIEPKRCSSDEECKTACMSMTAFVFSDGENPQLQYVTDCPNLDVPYRTERANHDGPDTEHQPALKRTKN
jgi:hypothetical protein